MNEIIELARSANEIIGYFGGAENIATWIEALVIFWVFVGAVLISKKG